MQQHEDTRQSKQPTGKRADFSCYCCENHKDISVYESFSRCKNSCAQNSVSSFQHLFIVNEQTCWPAATWLMAAGSGGLGAAWLVGSGSGAVVTFGFNPPLHFKSSVSLITIH